MPTAINDYGSYEVLPEGPARHAAAVTPHDTNELTNVTRAIYVGGSGNVKVTTIGGETATFTAVPAGAVLPIAAKIIWSTGTTATSMLALW